MLNKQTQTTAHGHNPHTMNNAPTRQQVIASLENSIAECLEMIQTVEKRIDTHREKGNTGFTSQAMSKDIALNAQLRQSLRAIDAQLYSLESK